MADTKAIRAKKKTLDKWARVWEKLAEAHEIMRETCAFCRVGPNCMACLATDVCCAEQHLDAVHAIREAADASTTLIDKIREIKVS